MAAGFLFLAAVSSSRARWMAWLRKAGLAGNLLETWCWVPSGERKHMIHFEELGDFLRDAIYNRLTTSHPCPPNF